MTFSSAKEAFFPILYLAIRYKKKKKTPPEPRIEQRFSIISSLVSRGVALQSFISLAKLRAAQAKQVFHEQDKLLPIEHTQYNLCELEFFSFDILISGMLHGIVKKAICFMYYLFDFVMPVLPSGRTLED